MTTRFTMAEWPENSREAMTPEDFAKAKADVAELDALLREKGFTFVGSTDMGNISHWHTGDLIHDSLGCYVNLREPVEIPQGPVEIIIRTLKDG